MKKYFGWVLCALILTVSVLASPIGQAGVQDVRIWYAGATVSGSNPLAVIGASGANVMGRVGIDQTTSGITNAVTQTVATQGGVTTSYPNSALTSTAVTVKAGAGNVYWYSTHNPDATNDATLEIFSIAAGSVVVGTTVPVFFISLGPGQTANFALIPPVTCGTQISAVAVKGDAISGTTAPNTAIQVCVGYN